MESLRICPRIGIIEEMAGIGKKGAHGIISFCPLAFFKPAMTCQSLEYLMDFFCRWYFIFHRNLPPFKLVSTLLPQIIFTLYQNHCVFSPLELYYNVYL